MPARGVDPSADPLPCFEEHDVPTGVAERQRRRQPRQTRAGDDDAARRAGIGTVREMDIGHGGMMHG